MFLGSSQLSRGNKRKVNKLSKESQLLQIAVHSGNPECPHGDRHWARPWQYSLLEIRHSFWTSRGVCSSESDRKQKALPPKKKFSYVQAMRSAEQEINLDRTQCDQGRISTGKVAWAGFFKELLSEQRPEGLGGGSQVEREELCQATGEREP